MKICPFCAEQIQDEAIVCKHCKRDLYEQPQRKISGLDWLIFSIFGLLLVCFACGLFMQSGIATNSEEGVIDLTNEPKPTSRPRPTKTPKPTIRPTPIPSTMGRLESVLSNELRDSNRDVARVSEINKNEITEQINITWTINDNLTEKLIRYGARKDIITILDTIYHSNVDFEEVFLSGTFSMVDQYGDSSEDIVIKALYTKSILDDINWDAEYILIDTIYDIALTSDVHKTFLGEY
jgi:hypothetical protein